MAGEDSKAIGMRGFVVVVAIALSSLMLAGCTGGGGEAARSIRVSHAQADQVVRITVDEVEGGPVGYADLVIWHSNKAYRYGPAADFEMGRFGVQDKTGSAAVMAAGDVVIVPASGAVQVRILDAAGEELASFSANVPDATAPEVPERIEPEVAATDVANRPTFRWSEVPDPAGVRYTVSYSLESSFAIPALVTTVTSLEDPEYEVPSGGELFLGQTYYWRVRAVDGAENESPWSATGQFRVAAI